MSLSINLTWERNRSWPIHTYIHTYIHTFDYTDGNISRPVTKPIRNSKLELFRIIVMLLIIAHHYVVNSGLTELMYNDPLKPNSIFLFLFGAWGKTGINCFVMITGYFMCRSEITLKKFIKLLFEVEFYKIIIYLVFIFTGYEEFSLKALLKTLIPVYDITTGFTSCFLIFYLFIPFLNILIKNLSEKQHLRLMILVSFMYIIIGTVPKFDVTMNYVSWFIVLYFIASYIRIYDRPVFNNTKIWCIITIIMFIVSSLSVVACVYLSSRLGLQMAFYFVADCNKILAVLLGISSFILFKNLKIKNNRFINVVSACTFGVLLIHANSDTMRKWLWRDLLNNTQMFGSDLLILHALLSVFGIFIICNAIDQIRARFIEKPLLSVYDRKYQALKNSWENFDKKLSEKLRITE